MTSNFNNIYQSNIAVINASQNATPILLKYVNESAAHDSYARRNKDSCYEGTRTQHIHDITAWATSATPPRNRLLWMHGPAGVGKSTIAQSCSKEADNAGTLGASFFFTRDNGVVDPSQFFTTIAYQVSRKHHKYEEILGRKIISDPTLLTKGLETQMKALIVNPFLELARQNMEMNPFVVFVDGLDECQDTGAQAEIVKLVTDSIRAHGADIPLLWAIFSRQEPHIHAAFSTTSLCWTVGLPVSRKLDGEIRIYLKGALTRRSNGVLDSVSKIQSWPSDEHLTTLVEVSAGLFIYAATLARFITDPDFDPEEQLHAVLAFHSDRKERSVNPIVELDAFYRMILARIPPKILSIIQHVLLLNFEGTYEFVAGLGQLPALAILVGRGMASLMDSLSRLHSVLTVKHSKERNLCCKWDEWRLADISFHHASFMEFLMDPERSKEFCIDDQRHWSSLVLACLRLLNGIHAIYGKGSRNEKVDKLEQLFSAVPDDTCFRYQRHLFFCQDWLYDFISGSLLRWCELAGLEPGGTIVEALHHVDFEMLRRMGPIDIDLRLLEKFPDALRQRITRLLPPSLGRRSLQEISLDIPASDLMRIDVVWLHLSTALNTIISASGVLSSNDKEKFGYMLRVFHANAEREDIRQLNSKTEEYLSTHIQSTIKQVECADLDEWNLLHCYLEEWRPYKRVVKFLQSPFDPSRACSESVERLYALPMLALSHWMLGVFRAMQGTDLRLTKVVINLMTSQRAEDRIDIHLVRRFIKCLTALEFDHNPNIWHYDINNFRGDFLQATKEFYTSERIAFLNQNSLQSYLAFVADRLGEEWSHAERFLPKEILGNKEWRAQEESAVTCRDALVGDSWELIFVEFENQLGHGNHRCLKHIRHIVLVDTYRDRAVKLKNNDVYIYRFERIFKSHIRKAVLAAISSIATASHKASETSADDLSLLTSLKRHYSDIIEQAFREDKHLSNVLDEVYDNVLSEHPQLYQAYHRHAAGHVESDSNGSGADDNARTAASRETEPETVRLPPPSVLANSRPTTPLDNTSNRVSTSNMTCIGALLGPTVQLTMGNTYSGVNPGQIVLGQNTMNQSTYKDFSSSQPPVVSTTYKRPATASLKDLSVKKTKVANAIPGDPSENVGVNHISAAVDDSLPFIVTCSNT